MRVGKSYTADEVVEIVKKDIEFLQEFRRRSLLLPVVNHFHSLYFSKRCCRHVKWQI